MADLAIPVEHLEDLHAAVAIADQRVPIANPLVTYGDLVRLVALLAFIFFADHGQAAPLEAELLQDIDLVDGCNFLVPLRMLHFLLTLVALND